MNILLLTAHIQLLFTSENAIGHVCMWFVISWLLELTVAFTAVSRDRNSTVKSAGPCSFSSGTMVTESSVVMMIWRQRYYMMILLCIISSNVLFLFLLMFLQTSKVRITCVQDIVATRSPLQCDTTCLQLLLFHLYVTIIHVLLHWWTPYCMQYWETESL